MKLSEHTPRLTYRKVFEFIIILCLLVSCSANNGLPTEAQKAVEDAAQAYYTSPWQGSTHFADVAWIEITRAWRAKDIDQGEGSGEMWCVGLTVSGILAGSTEEVSAVWIVARENAHAEWQAAALETISASTTIERCGL
jgi:hypothetical protein